MEPTAGEYDEAIRDLDNLLEAFATVLRWQVEVDDSHKAVERVDDVKRVLAEFERHRDIVPEDARTELMDRAKRLHTLVHAWRYGSDQEGTPPGQAENTVERKEPDGEQAQTDHKRDLDKLTWCAYVARPACSKLLSAWQRKAWLREAVDSLNQLDLPPATRDRFRAALTCRVEDPGQGPGPDGHPPDVIARVHDQFETLRAACNEARDLWSLAEDEPAEEPPRLLGNITRILDDLARRAERASSIANTIPLPPNPPPPMVPGPVPKPGPKPE